MLAKAAPRAAAKTAAECMRPFALSRSPKMQRFWTPPQLEEFRHALLAKCDDLRAETGRPAFLQCLLQRVSGTSVPGSIRPENCRAGRTVSPQRRECGVPWRGSSSGLNGPSSCPWARRYEHNVNFRSRNYRTPAQAAARRHAGAMLERLKKSTGPQDELGACAAVHTCTAKQYGHRGKAG